MVSENCDCGSCHCTDQDKKLVKIYFCPICQSTNVRFHFGLKNLFGVIPQMKCFDCDFVAPTFPQFVELPKKKVKKRGSVKNSKTKKKVGGKR